MHIDTTVRAAYDHDFKSIAFGDACATKDLKLDGEVNAKSSNCIFGWFEWNFAEVKKTNDFIHEY
jgi:hypothetical protein